MPTLLVLAVVNLLSLSTLVYLFVYLGTVVDVDDANVNDAELAGEEERRLDKDDLGSCNFYFFRNSLLSDVSPFSNLLARPLLAQLLHSGSCSRRAVTMLNRALVNRPL